jgi:NADPH:quinone reductase-like Zn-dependent oxidoreductase
MKEVIVHPTPTLHITIHDVPIPTPGPNELVIKVIVAGCNPKGRPSLSSPFHHQPPISPASSYPPPNQLTKTTDWDHLTSQNLSLNSGDDFAGIVYSIGTEVAKTCEFNIGDRVAGFHPMMTPHGAFAEYAVAPGATVFKLGEGVSFEGTLI